MHYGSESVLISTVASKLFTFFPPEWPAQWEKQREEKNNHQDEMGIITITDKQTLNLGECNLTNKTNYSLLQAIHFKAYPVCCQVLVLTEKTFNNLHLQRPSFLLYLKWNTILHHSVMNRVLTFALSCSKMS